MKHRFLSLLGSLVFTISLSVGLLGCQSDAEAVCDLKCDCEGCSDYDLDDCYDNVDDEARSADYNGCLDLYDDLKACEYDTGFCKSGFDWDTSCKPEKERYDNCRK